MNESSIKKQNDQWLQSHWRPAVGVAYIVINVFDFIIFPMLWTATSYLTKHDITQWKPLTLEYTGVFHLAFGAILGVAAWSRGVEKQYQQQYDYQQREDYPRDYRRPSFERPSYERSRYTSNNRELNDSFTEPSSVFRGEQNDR